MKSKWFFLLLFSVLGAASSKASAKVFLLNDDGGEHSPAGCENKNAAPTKLVQKKNMKKYKSYIGSVQTEFADKNEAAIDAWAHYFKKDSDCAAALLSLSQED